MKLQRIIKVSLKVLFGNKTRTFLSSLAVGIGVAAVVMMVGTGKAIERETQKKIEKFGTDLLTVRAGKFKSVGGRTIQVQRYTSLTPNDVRVLERKVQSIKNLGGTIDRRTVAFYKNVRTNTRLRGLEPSLFEILRIGAKSGKLFTHTDESRMSKVCVLGKTVKENLFKDEDAVNKTIFVFNVPFKVIGVATERGQDLTGEDLDDVIYIPLSTAMKRIFETTYLENIIIQAKEGVNLETLKKEIEAVLRKSHGLRPDKENDFEIQDQNQIIEAQVSTQKAFSYLIILVAALSLLTGGIGIFAVMLISLRERKNEVGLRRAIGARHKDILIQFLIEASMLSLSGGIIGTIAGTIGCCILAKINGWETFVPLNIILIAFIFSFLIGITFGIYPAKVASKLEPAEALRAVV